MYMQMRIAKCHWGGERGRQSLQLTNRAGRGWGGVGGCGRKEGGMSGEDLISRGKFLMQGDPREIKTAGLITGGAARDEFIFAAV